MSHDPAAATAPTWPSEGDRVAGRLLEKEQRAGVTHYVSGQYEAIYHSGGEDYSTGEPIDVGRLTYVDLMGHLCVVLLARRDASEAWRVTWVGRTGQTHSSPARKIEQPDEFPLSERMLAALADAKEEPWPTV